MARDERVHAHLARGVKRVNDRFARAEQAKRFVILGRDLAQDTGELTHPDGEASRRVLKVQDVIDSLSARRSRCETARPFASARNTARTGNCCCAGSSASAPILATGASSRRSRSTRRRGRCRRGPLRPRSGPPQVAEVAVTVIDEWQGRGLGTPLLEVISAPRERRESGNRHLHCPDAGHESGDDGSAQGARHGADRRSRSRQDRDRSTHPSRRIGARAQETDPYRSPARRDGTPRGPWETTTRRGRGSTSAIRSDIWQLRGP